MKIETISVTARKRSFSIETDGCDFVLIYGPNEAGKSSLRSFIAQTLYSTSRTRSGDLPGSLVVDIDGLDVEIERNLRDRTVRVPLEGRLIPDPQAPTLALLRGSNQPLLSQLGRLCTFDLTDLKLLQSARPTEIEDLLAGLIQSGVRGRSLRKIEMEIKKELDEVYRQRAECELSRTAEDYKALKRQQYEIESGYRAAQELTSQIQSRRISLEEMRLIRSTNSRYLDQMNLALETARSLSLSLQSLPSHVLDIPLLDAESIRSLIKMATSARVIGTAYTAAHKEVDAALAQLESVRFAGREAMALKLVCAALSITTEAIEEDIRRLERDKIQLGDELNGAIRTLDLDRAPQVYSTDADLERQLEELGRELSSQSKNLAEADADLRRWNSDPSGALDHEAGDRLGAELSALKAFQAASVKLTESQDRLSRVYQYSRGGAGRPLWLLLGVFLLGLVAFSFTLGSHSLVAMAATLSLAVILGYLVVAEIRAGSRSEDGRLQLLEQQVNLDRSNFEAVHRDLSEAGWGVDSYPVNIQERIDDLTEAQARYRSEALSVRRLESERSRAIEIVSTTHFRLDQLELEASRVLQTLLGIEYSRIRHGDLLALYRSARRLAAKGSEIDQLRSLIDSSKVQLDEALRSRRSLAIEALGHLGLVHRVDRELDQLRDVRRTLIDSEANFLSISSQLERAQQRQTVCQIDKDAADQALITALISLGVAVEGIEANQLIEEIDGSRDFLSVVWRDLSDLVGAIDGLGDSGVETSGEFTSALEELYLVRSRLLSYLDRRRVPALADVVKTVDSVGELCGRCVDHVSRTLDQAQFEIDEATRLIARDSDALALYESADLFSINDDLSDTGERCKALLARATRLRAEAWILDRARSLYVKRGQPLALREASRFLNIATGGRYPEVAINLDEEIRVVDAKGDERSVGELSTGTFDLLMLGMRIAYLSSPNSIQSHWPIFFDDVMVNIDAHRRVDAATSILLTARSRQAFYMTCHRDHFERLVTAAEVQARELPSFRYKTIEMERISL